MTVVLDEAPLTIGEVVRVARQYEQVALGNEARQKVAICRDVMEGLAKSKVVYGINTGFGALSKVTISPGDLEELQINLCCVVEPLQQADYEKNEDRGRSYEKTMQHVREEGSTERAIHLYEMR